MVAVALKLVEAMFFCVFGLLILVGVCVSIGSLLYICFRVEFLWCVLYRINGGKCFCELRLWCVGEDVICFQCLCVGCVFVCGWYGWVFMFFFVFW